MGATAMGKVGIGGAIGASFASIGTAWRRAPAIMVMVVLVTGASALLSRMLARDALVSLTMSVVLMFVSAAVLGALFRIGLQRDHASDPDFVAGPGGLQWGATEWRVLGSSLLVGVLFGVIIAVVAIGWLVALGVALKGDASAFEAVGNASTPMAQLAAAIELLRGPAGVVTVAIWGPALIILLYTSARISLFTVQTVDTRSFNLGKAWSLAGGAVWPLLLGIVVISLTQVLMGFLGGAVAGVAAASSGHAGQSAAWGAVGGQMLGAVVSGPLFAGLQIYVYRARVGDRDVADTFA